MLDKKSYIWALFGINPVILDTNRKIAKIVADYQLSPPTIVKLTNGLMNYKHAYYWVNPGKRKLTKTIYIAVVLLAKLNTVEERHFKTYKGRTRAVFKGLDRVFDTPTNGEHRLTIDEQDYLLTADFTKADGEFEVVYL